MRTGVPPIYGLHSTTEGDRVPQDNPFAGLPFTDSDAEIAVALEDVSIPTLILSLVHITGNPEWLRTDLRPQGLFLNEVQGYMTQEQQAEARRLALPVLAAYRDAGCPPVKPLTEDLMGEMMSWLVCEDVPDEYVPMMREEMHIDGDGTDRTVDWAAISDEAKANLPVVVIGCGQSGLWAGIQLKAAGLPFTIIEKNAGPGGTWYENRYPGCRVDVGNHFYCYSTEPSDHWTEFFSQAPELSAYFKTVLDRHDLDQSVKWQTEVVEAVWHEEQKRWHVTIRGDDGTTEVLEARAVISAVGQLNRPKLPDIEGIDTFNGPLFHSARWDQSVDYKGKRVVLIGAGASGFQIAPTIAPDVEHLTVFQRTAQWMFPNPNYHKQVGAGVKWALRHLPFYGRWYRFLLFWPGCDGGLRAARVDPTWPHQERSVSESNEATRELFTSWIVDQVGDDEDLQAKVIPDYPPTGKRTLQDNGSWLKSLTRDNVELIRDGISRITPEGVIDSHGELHPADIIVCATGFHANKFLWPMRIEGRGGAVLSEQWGEEPTAYLGITVPNFPNLFCMYGPGTNLAHGGSLIFHSECQMRYISDCLETLAQDPTSTLEPKLAVHDDYVERTQRELDGLVWSQPSVTSTWYKNSKGRIYILSPWRLVDYWAWTKNVDLADFEVG